MYYWNLVSESHHDGSGLCQRGSGVLWSRGADLVERTSRCSLPAGGVVNSDVCTTVELFLCAAAETRRPVLIATPVVACTSHHRVYTIKPVVIGWTTCCVMYAQLRSLVPTATNCLQVKLTVP